MTMHAGSKLGPYEILSPIGSGGMGEVWKARDSRLDRVVAIKKVKEQHGERFRREARSIAALNHPNICQIHDIGEDYLVLEYVEGTPLCCPIPEKQAVELAVQITAALEEAHKHGIIHRDLKPSNIMVTENGIVKLLDFGLARLYDHDPSISKQSTADFPATRTGAVLGTVPYMSPEQAQGKPADARSDIFSLGLVLYELLSGRRAFYGDSGYVVMDAIVKKDPPPLQASAWMDRIVRRCLEKNPSDRYQTASELQAALKSGGDLKISTSSLEPRASIAVLPFVNMSGDKEQEYFSDGLAEEIINALTKLPGLKVSARTSAFSFRGKEQDITEIARALRVKTVLEGSVRKSGDRIRVTSQLINASDGYHLWSERYDRRMTDVFQIQDEICQAIVAKLRVKLAPGQPLVRRYTENADAYNLLLKGRYHFYKFTPYSLATSKEYFEQAVALDRNYALAWCRLARYHNVMGYLGFVSPAKAHERACNAAENAVKLDETLAEAHAVTGVLKAREYAWQESEQAFSRALELDPASEDNLQNYSIFHLMPLGRLDEALAVSQKVLELDLLSSFHESELAIKYYFLRDYLTAIEHTRKALKLDPHYYLAHQYMGLSYIEQGEFDKAIESLKLAVQFSSKAHLCLGILGYACARGGKIEQAKEMLRELEILSRKMFVLPTSIAQIYTGLGKPDEALDWLEKGLTELDGQMLLLKILPLYDLLRSHSRYKTLLRNMNLE